MLQLSMFDEVPNKPVKVRKVKATQLSMFAGHDMSAKAGRAVVPADAKPMALVLAHPDEDEDMARERMARENTGRMF